MIKINYARIAPDHHRYLDRFLNALPPSMKAGLEAVRLDDDKIRSAIGKILLKKLLIESGYLGNVLEGIGKDKYGRPMLDHTIDFNIAHSGDYIVCAVSRETKLGIDIEKIRTIDPDDFNIGLSDEELVEIKNHASPSQHFFSIWTRKEAVSKANGKGLEILLTDIVLKGDHALSDQQRWTLTRLEIDQGYSSHIAYTGMSDIAMDVVELRDLLDVV